VVHSSITGEQRTLDAMRAGGLEPTVLRRERSPLGPLHGSRVEVLEQRGLLEPGHREEDVLVIRGTAPH
jgi:release factor glutamine methyltransferase